MAPDATHLADLANMFVTAALHDEEALVKELYNELSSDDQTWLVVGLINCARALVRGLAVQYDEDPVVLWQRMLLSERLACG